MTTRDDIAEAYGRIRPFLRRTPIVEMEADGFGAHAPLLLKLELMQHSAAFKVRGAFNNLLSRAIPPAGVAAASGGNHGAAVAHAAARLGIKARIFVPEISPPLKLQRIREAGAEVVIAGAAYAEARAECEAYVAASGALDIHAYDSPQTIAGQGTVAAEWEEQAEAPLDTVLVAVGGGGLIAGVAAWFAGRVRVVGVEPERIPTLHAALEAGRPVDVEVSGVAADSLGARRVGAHVLPIAAAHVERVVLVPDAAIREAQRQLLKILRIVSEPGGAAALAALTAGAYRPEKDERVGVLICGGNADPATFI